MKKITTTTPEETKQIARDFARQLHPGDLVLLTGDLGAGKTTFVQGIAEGLGASTPATSPSFVIVNEYPLGGMGHGAWATGKQYGEPSPKPQHPSPIVLRHIDLYRLPVPRAESMGDPTIDLDRIGLPELLSDPDAITAVEWADRLPLELASTLREVVTITMAHGEQEGERSMTIEGGR